MPKRTMLALVAILSGPSAHASGRTPESTLRELAAPVTMGYIACHLDARSAIATVRSKRASRDAVVPADTDKVTACIAKAKETLYDRIPDLNLVVSAKREAAPMIKDWYNYVLNSLDRLTVDVANLRESQDAAPELDLRLQKALSELR